MTIVFAITSGCAFIFYMFLGSFVLILDYKSQLNRNFFYFTTLLALWSLGHFLCFLTPLTAQKELYQRFYYVPGSLFPVFILKFILILTRNYKKKIIKILMNTVVWIFPLIISCISITSNAIANTAPFSWYLYFNCQSFTFNIIGIIVLFKWQQNTKLNREKKQATILLLSGLITIIIGWIVDIIASFYNLDPISSSTNLILVICLIYAMARYGFIQLTTPYVYEEIIANIEESIILLNNQLKIISANRFCEKILDQKENDILNKDISLIIREQENFINKLKNLITGKSGNFSGQIHFVRKNKTKAFMDVKCSIIKDKYNDILGVLMIGKETKILKQLKELYKITTREIEVIQLIMRGQVNREIAINLGVTERTIKSHITNIYSKLNVENKIQLMLLLKNF